MGDQGLLQKLPDIPALWPNGGDSRQWAEADGATARAVATAVVRPIPELALNHRLVQGS